MIVLGYARLSTKRHALIAAGAKRSFTYKRSGARDDCEDLLVPAPRHLLDRQYLYQRTISWKDEVERTHTWCQRLQ